MFSSEDFVTCKNPHCNNNHQEVINVVKKVWDFFVFLWTFSTSTSFKWQQHNSSEWLYIQIDSHLPDEHEQAIMNNNKNNYNNNNNKLFIDNISVSYWKSTCSTGSDIKVRIKNKICELTCNCNRIINMQNNYLVFMMCTSVAMMFLYLSVRYTEWSQLVVASCGVDGGEAWGNSRCWWHGWLSRPTLSFLRMPWCLSGSHGRSRAVMPSP